MSSGVIEKKSVDYQYERNGMSIDATRLAAGLAVGTRDSRRRDAGLIERLRYC